MIHSRNIPSFSEKRTLAKINLDHAAYNFACIRSATDSKLCCVIKANAYGHGAIQLGRLYQFLGADYLAVSNIEEALQLRNHSISIPVLILGYTSPDCAKILAKNDITQRVFSHEYGIKLAKHAKEYGVTVKIHIKLDTGMGRIGFLCRTSGENEIAKAIEICKNPSLLPEGIFMHFATADEGSDGEAYAREQFSEFINAIEGFHQSGIDFSIRHCANSAAIFSYPEYHLDMVRAGIVLYGLAPSEQVRNLPNLKPVMSLRSVIAHIKTVEQGQTISYGRTYTVFKQQKIATVPIGYADGFRRGNGQGRYCLCINGQKAPIVGRICMDQLMVDVTDIGCAVGDEVIVFGDIQPFTADEIAKINGTINYEIVCDVGKRVPRAFVKDGVITDWQDALTN